MEGHSAGQAYVTGTIEASPGHQSNEWNNVEGDVALNYIANEDIAFIVYILNFYCIVETVDTKLWRNKTYIEILTNMVYSCKHIV